MNLFIGIASAIVMIVVWAGFIVFGRLGVTTSLTPADLTGLRYLVCGGLTLPFVYWWWPKRLSWKQCAALAVTGPGIPYTFFSFWGLTLAPASYGGVFLNGMMPLITVLLGVVFLADKIGSRALVGIALVLVGAGLLGLFDADQVGTGVWFGALFLIAAAFTLSCYVLLVRAWQVSPTEALAVINIPNLVLILPLWIWVMDSGLAQTPMKTIIFQALFHGLGPGFAAVIAYALMVKHLGSTTTAAASAFVPVLVTLLAIPVLAEWPTSVQWLGVAVVTFGLFVLVLRQNSKGRAT